MTITYHLAAERIIESSPDPAGLRRQLERAISIARAAYPDHWPSRRALRADVSRGIIALSRAVAGKAIPALHASASLDSPRILISCLHVGSLYLTLSSESRRAGAPPRVQCMRVTAAPDSPIGRRLAALPGSLHGALTSCSGCRRAATPETWRRRLDVIEDARRAAAALESAEHAGQLRSALTDIDPDGEGTRWAMAAVDRVTIAHGDGDGHGIPAALRNRGWQPSGGGHIAMTSATDTYTRA